MKHILPNTKYVYAHMIEFALIRIVFSVFLYIYVFIIFPFINIYHVLSPSVSVGGHSGHPSL